VNDRCEPIENKTLAIIESLEKHRNKTIEETIVKTQHTQNNQEQHINAIHSLINKQIT
jgi:hypothetical protein